MNKHNVLFQAMNKWQTGTIESHLQYITRIRDTRPEYAAMVSEEIEICNYILDQRRKPKEPDICDLIMQEAA